MTRELPENKFQDIIEAQFMREQTQNIVLSAETEQKVKTYPIMEKIINI